MLVIWLVFFGLTIIYGLPRLAWGIMRWYLLKRHSGIAEIRKIGKVQTCGQRLLNGIVVICGGSIAGLLAARVCHDFFERVIIIEPEEWLTSEDGIRRFGWEQEHKRTRIMQYQSLHGCQPFFYDGLEKLFPELEDQCRYSGISVFPGPRKGNFAGTPLLAPTKSYDGNPKSMQCSRQGLETLLRRLVLGRGEYPRIEQITGTVIGVSPHQDSNSSRIHTVKFRGADSKVQELNASLVVDCTGYTRAGLKWLSQSGYGTAQAYPAGKVSLQDSRMAFDQKLHYSSLTCKVTPSTFKKLPIPSDRKLETFLYLFLEDQPDKGRRMFCMLRLEGDRVLLFVGQSSDEPVKYDSIDAIRTLVSGLVPYKEPIEEWVFQTLNILEESEPDVVYSHVRVPGTSYIQYHQMMNLPSNFVALGDSVLSVDPIFGQGCTKALLGAVALHTVLSNIKHPDPTELPPNFSELFFKEHFDKTDNFWQTTRLIDYGIPCTTPLPGEDLSSGRQVRWYSRQLQILATKDEQAARVYWDSAEGFASPIDAFHPWLIIKVLWNAVICGTT